MSKRITEITIEQTEDYRIVYTPADKDYGLFLTGLGIMGYFKKADDARAMITSYRENGLLDNACAGFGCVDTCGDCVQVQG